MSSLRTKLTLSHALAVLVAVALVGLLSAWLVSRGFDQLAQAQARRDAAQIAEAMSGIANAPGASAEPLRAIRRRLAAPDQPALLRGAPFVLADARRKVVVDRGGSLEGQPLPPALSRNAAPITAGNRIVGYVAMPVERRLLNVAERAVVARIYVGMLVGSMAAGLLAVCIGLASARRQTRPLRALTVAAGQLARGERLDPVAVTTRDEVGALATAFNTMADDLARQQQLRRNLVADIAHELRTPLSVLQLQAEALHDGVTPPTPEAFASLVEEVGLLNHLVADLRLLSLADAGQLPVAPEQLDAADAARRAVAMAQPRAAQRQVALCCDTSASPQGVYADPQRLAQVLGILLDNALRYTPPEGAVRLRVYASQPSAIFEVSDSGPGIAPTDLLHVFERFYRADHARSRETGGSGLGLAIAQRLVAAMGGSIWAESPPGEGARFYVALPTAANGTRTSADERGRRQKQ